MNKCTLPNVEEFRKWYSLLMSSAPSDYVPHLFVLEPQGKDPLASRPWAADKSRLSLDEAIRWMEYGHNIGVSALEKDQLVLIDIDDTIAIPESDIKPTLSVITRSRVGSHHYYFTTDPKCVCNLPTDFGEVRSCNQYLVCCGSYVKTDCSEVPIDQQEYCGYYTLQNKVSPVSIAFQEFPKVFRDHADLINHTPTPQKIEPSGHKSKSMLFDLTIDDVIKYPRHKARFPSPFHDSKSGANAAVSNGIVHCFRHLVSHNAIQALSVLAGVYSCQEAGKSHRNGGSGPSMVDMRDGNTSYVIWQYARTERYISIDDTPPSAAIRWFAIESGICTEDDVIDGWKLSSWAYSEARKLLLTNV